MTKEYIVTGRTNGTTKRGDPYCSLKLKNLEEEFSIAVWDVAPTEGPVVGQLVSFINIQENDGKKSAKRVDMQPGFIPNESHPLYKLIPRPIDRATWDTCLQHLTDLCSDEQLKPLVKEYGDVLFKTYAKYPAATNIHHAFKGGLLNHTYQMLHMLEGLYRVSSLSFSTTTGKYMNISPMAKPATTNIYLAISLSRPIVCKPNSRNIRYRRRKSITLFTSCCLIMVNWNMAPP